MTQKKVNAIEVKNVTKVYRSSNTETRALRNANLTIYDNEFFTLLGPSGCGKTTLLRLIAGFEDITEGSINLFDQEIVNLPPNKRPVNTVFQQYSLFPHLDVYENDAFGLRRLKKDERLAEYIKIKDKYFNQSIETGLSKKEKINYKKFLNEYEEYKNLYNIRNHQNITEIRILIEKHKNDAKIHLGGIPMIADDMMTYIKMFSAFLKP